MNAVYFNIKMRSGENENASIMYHLRIEAIPRIYKDNPSMINNFIEMYSE